MVPILAMVAASAPADEMRPWLTLTRAPALERVETIVEIGPLPNARKEMIYLFRRSVRRGENVELSWADSKSCPAAMWVVEEAMNVPPPRIQVPGVTDPTAPDVISLTIDGVGYSMSSGARYGSQIASTIRFTSNAGTPLAAWVEESLRRLQPCWSWERPRS